MKQPSILLFCALLFSFNSYAQQYNWIYGKIINGFTKEPIGYSTARWKIAKKGVISDSIGVFKIQTSNYSKDTLIIEFVGYEAELYPMNKYTKDTSTYILERVKQIDEVQVKTKFNKGNRWWKQVVNNKSKNNPYQHQFYKAELYNKLELDLNNVKRESFDNVKMLKPFSFILDNIDSITESKPFLPIFLTESISDYYFIKDPENSREFIKGTMTHGLQNETIMQFIGGVSQKMNIYENYMRIFGKEFISPISDMGDKFYKYRGADTQYINNLKVYHLFFAPLKEGTNVFNGDAWIDATSWGIVKINMNISTSADINFVNRLSIVQAFNKKVDGGFLLYKNNVTADLSPFPKDKITFIARKSTYYQNFSFDSLLVFENVKLNQRKNEIIVKENAQLNNEIFWQNIRPDNLSNNEKKVIKMIDTLKSIPLFKAYSKNVEFFVDGYKKFDKIEIGPWYKWISGNQLEGVRLRFDIGTTNLFSKNLKLKGYLAYGTKDHQFKENFSVFYKIPNSNSWSIQASYLHDLENGRVRFSEEDNSIDNIFSQTLRRPGIPQKFLDEREVKFNITNDLKSGISHAFTFTNTIYEPFTPLPSIQDLNNGNIKQFISTDIMYRIRYAPSERKISTSRKQLRINGVDPIYEFRINHGLNGVAGSHYDYTKLHVGISQKIRLRNFGLINYNAYAGKVIGDSLPFMLLELHPGNEVYVYNKNGFNLMNRFEYFSDVFTGFQLEHNIEKKLMNLIPFLRKSKIRQFWTIKGVWGQMKSSNKVFNQTEFGPYHLRSLRSHTYLEYGTGFDNIFKFFRIDFVWRSAPLYPTNFKPSRIQPVQNFGVFGSLRFQF